MMPKQNGLQVFKRIKHHIKTSNQQQGSAVTVLSPRFIFCTAYSSVELKNYLQSKGVHEVFEKPFEIESLKEQIDISLV
jgi:CheY-like chemotaxis protein